MSVVSIHINIALFLCSASNCPRGPVNWSSRVKKPDGYEELSLHIRRS